MREIIFNMPDPNYRVVCRFGYSYSIDFAWWAHLKRRIPAKKVFGFTVYKGGWSKVTDCWFSREPESVAELEKWAEELYDETILLPVRIHEQAMNLK